MVVVNWDGLGISWAISGMQLGQRLYFLCSLYPCVLLVSLILEGDSKFSDESPSHKKIWQRMVVKVGSLLNDESPQVHVWDGINLKSSSVQFSHSIMSNSLRPQGLQHARPLCPSPTPGACSNSGPSNQWCHPAISSSVIPFSSCLQSFSALESFPVSQFFASGGQSIGVLKSRLLCFLCMEV